MRAVISRGCWGPKGHVYDSYDHPQIMGSAEDLWQELHATYVKLARQTARKKVINIRTARFSESPWSSKRRRDVLTHQQ